MEYLGSRRPILAIGRYTDVVTQLLEETGAGVHVTNIPDLKRFVLTAYRIWQRKGVVPYRGNEKALSRYTAEAMAGRFAQVLASITTYK